MHFTYSPRHRINLDMNSWPHYQWQAWFPSHGIGFKFSHKVVAYLNNICAIFFTNISSEQVPVVRFYRSAKLFLFSSGIMYILEPRRLVSKGKASC